MKIPSLQVVRDFRALAMGSCACLLSACSSNGLQDGLRSGASVAPRTAMVYLPGVPRGTTGRVLPYEVSPRSNGVSLAGTILGLTKAGSMTKNESSTPKRTAIINAAPEVVIGVALKLLAEGRPVTEASVKTGLVGVERRVPGNGIVTSIVSGRYPCNYNWSSVPSDLLGLACDGRLFSTLVSISGQPGVVEAGELKRLKLDSDVRLWYDDQRLRGDVKRVGLSVSDVSDKFDASWPGHLSRMTHELQIDGHHGGLVVAVTGSGRNNSVDINDVISVDFYQGAGV